MSAKVINMAEFLRNKKIKSANPSFSNINISSSGDLSFGGPVEDTNFSDEEETEKVVLSENISNLEQEYNQLYEKLKKIDDKIFSSLARFLNYAEQVTQTKNEFAHVRYLSSLLKDDIKSFSETLPQLLELKLKTLKELWKRNLLTEDDFKF